MAASSNKEEIEIDPKTQAVFHKKGYQITSKLGAGAFGQVYKAENLKTKKIVAVKVMSFDKMSDKIRTKFLPREMEALMEVKHPNAVRVYDIFRCNFKIYVFMEYASNGDLAGYVKKNKIVLEPLACIWFTQTSGAISYLHNTIRMSHRDIKLDNILLDENFNTKLTDFGFASLLTDGEDMEEFCSATFCGTVPYYCPQLTAKHKYNPFKADVWALAVVLYAMLNNRFPFHFQDVKRMYREQTNYPSYIESRFADKMSPSSKDLLLRMFDPNEHTRWDIDTVLTHDWIVNKGCEVPASNSESEASSVFD